MNYENDISFLLAFLPVLCWSCYDDKGNYDYHELNRTEVTGIKPVYRCEFVEPFIYSYCNPVGR